MEQDPNTQLWLVASLAFAIGLAAGALLCYLLRPRRTRRADLELEQLRQEFQSFRDRVNDHFSTSAHLSHRLTDAYRAVQEHLATSAGELCADEMTRLRLQEQQTPLHAPEAPAALPANAEEHTPAAPRDYADRVPGQPGELEQRLQASDPIETPRTPI